MFVCVCVWVQLYFIVANFFATKWQSASALWQEEEKVCIREEGDTGLLITLVPKVFFSLAQHTVHKIECPNI